MYTFKEATAMAEHEEKQTFPAKRGAGYNRPRQKYKSLLVWQVLLKRTDEDHAVYESFV